MLRNVIDRLPTLPRVLRLRRVRWAALRRRRFRRFYQGLAERSLQIDSWTTMNCGFAALDDQDGCTVPLSHVDEPERFSLQLYDRVVGKLNISRRVLVDVSCGRGGGTAFLHRTRCPEATIGLDFAPALISFCRARHRLRGLTFEVGDAEKLPFDPESVDVIVNIEASYCYGDISRFLVEVRRVLRPEGLLLFADLRLDRDVRNLVAVVEHSGLELLDVEDITENVVRSFALERVRAAPLTHDPAPASRRGAFGPLTGVVAPHRPTHASEESLAYLRITARKPSL